MTLVCVGTNHRTAGLEWREQLALGDADRRDMLERAAGWRSKGQLGCTELLVLSTCNRTELYGVDADRGPDHAASALLDLWCVSRRARVADVSPLTYQHTGHEAARHLCRVATGIDSLVVGEFEIVGQVTTAFRRASESGWTGPALAAAFETAVRSSRRARAETRISRRPASVSSVAVQLATDVCGDLRGRRVLVIGTGKMSRLFTAALRDSGCRAIAVSGRNPMKTAQLADALGGQAIPLERVEQALETSDIVFTATAAPGLVIEPWHARRALAVDREFPLVIVDIAVPRDVDPAVGQMDGVQLFNIDDLRRQIDQHLAERRREIPQVERIIEAELAALREREHQRRVRPLITAIRARAETIRRDELRRVLTAMPTADPAVQREVERLSRTLVNKLLHEPTRRLRTAPEAMERAGYAEVARDLFGVEPDEVRGNGRTGGEG